MIVTTIIIIIVMMVSTYIASVGAYGLPPFCVAKLDGDKDSKGIYATELKGNK